MLAILMNFAAAIALAAGVRPEFRVEALQRIMTGGEAIQKDSSFGEFNGVPAYWFARAIEPGAMAAMWQPMAESVWVQRAIKTVSLPISSVSLDFYPRGTEAFAGPRRRRYFTGQGRSVHRAADATLDLPQVRAFLEEPVEGLSYADFVEASVGWLKLEECFWLLSDTALVPFPQARTSLDKIIIAQPRRMRHVIEGGVLIGWTYTDLQGKAWTLLPDQVIQIKFWNPYNPWRGLGEYASARIAAEADHLCGKFERNLAANNGDTGPFIIAKNGVPSDPQREQMIAELRAKRQAQLRGDFKPIFLTGDISVEDPQIKSVDTAFIASRLEKRHEIYAAFGVPMSMADVVASYSIGSASDWFRLITETCIPNGAKFCGALGQLIRRLIGQDVEVLQNWDEHPVMQAVRRERMVSADSLFAKGVPMSVANEYLDLGLPDYQGIDIGYVPINLTPVTGDTAEEQAAPLTDDDYAEGKPTEGNEGNEGTKAVREMLTALRPGAVAKARNKERWLAHMRRRSGYIKLLQSHASKVFFSYRAKALKILHATYGKKSLIDIIFDKDAFSRDITGTLRNPMNAVLEGAVNDLMAEIGRTDDPWKMPAKAALDFIKQRENKISGVSDTAFDQLKTALTNATQAGSNVDEIADAVRGVFNNLGKFEARRIAMTEVCALDGFARHEGMKGAGIEYKSWLSSHGPNVRPAHAAAEARYEAAPIPVDDPFEVGGEELMYPGDESGSPENVINCQCIQLACAGPKGDES